VPRHPLKRAYLIFVESVTAFFPHDEYKASISPMTPSGARRVTIAT
jgi:hypothetical protein